MFSDRIARGKTFKSGFGRKVMTGIGARPLPSNETWSQFFWQIGGQISDRLLPMAAWREGARPLVDSDLTGAS